MVRALSVDSRFESAPIVLLALPARPKLASVEAFKADELQMPKKNKKKMKAGLYTRLRLIPHVLTIFEQKWPRRDEVPLPIKSIDYNSLWLTAVFV